MKVTALLNRSILATLLLSATVTAFAGGGGGSRGPGPNLWSPATSHIKPVVADAAPASAPRADATPIAGNSHASGKTRAEVRAELLQAEEAGVIPVHKNDYPPSAETIARNRVRFHQVEQAWQAHEPLTASNQ